MRHIETWITRIYIIASIPAFAFLFSLQRKSETEVFEVIDAKRINIVEDSGTTALTLSNRSRSPGGTVRGKKLRPDGTRPAGLIFHNKEGDEMGGLTFAGDKDLVGGGLTFDRHQQDQVLQFSYIEKKGHYWAGVQVTDRPELPLDLFVEDANAMKSLQGEELKIAQEAFKKKYPSTPRLSLGRRNDKVILSMQDGKGRTRLRLSVHENGNAAMEFLDESGNVVKEFSPESSTVAH
ncbi:MAG: hypothetical protein HRU19_15985 [Pseudobacteriovorax sp.]|nr:hypothetical protein [Pseudobacteriovorax sp.]